MPGSPSQMDTFDYKPELKRRHGEKLEGADKKTGFFTTSGKVLKSPFKFQQHGESGAHVAEIFPHMAKHVDDMAVIRSCWADGLNHVGSVCQMNTGSILGGRPSLGAWAVYGLGTLNNDLPSFVVLKDTKKLPLGGVRNWACGSES